MLGRPILTAQQMRDAEQSVIDAGTPVETLMERAGQALAEAIYRFAGPRPALILAGPGNNGGDGYVAARNLAERGVKVRVAALAEPATDAARWARSQWNGPVEDLMAAAPAPVLVDCLFGTGLKRPLDGALVQRLAGLVDAAGLSVACDLPSGTDADSGDTIAWPWRCDLTVTFGALKPAHRLMPAMAACGRVVLAGIGIAVDSDWQEIHRPILIGLSPTAHKYSRGMVAVVAGAMPGAAALAATAAARNRAGYVRLVADQPIANVPAAIVQGQSGDLSDERIGAIVVGPGLGRGGKSILKKCLASKRPLVVDGDALRLIGVGDCAGAILTPHDGEFEALFGKLEGSKAERALEAARETGAVVVYKGPDTLVASPDGRLGFAPPAPAWLATAGTGDVLAGMIGALRSQGHEPFVAACAAVWLHGRAAEIAGPHMIADDLVDAIPQALALAE